MGALICAVSAVGFAYSYDYFTAICFRALTGLGSSFGFVCLLVAVYDWLPTKNVAFLIGVSQFIGTMGPMLAAGPLESMSESGSVDWRVVFTILGVFGFALSLFIAFFVKNNRKKSGEYIILNRPESIKKTMKSLISKAQPWYIASFAALVYFSLEYLSENEGKIFLTLKGFSPAAAAYTITFSWVGYAIGCPFMGWVSDYFKRRRPIMIFAAFSSAISIICIIFSHNNLVLLASFFFLGVGASGQSVAFAAIAEQFKKSYLAVALSFNNTLLMFLGAINAPILGSIIDLSKTEGAQPHLSDYMLAFTILAAVVSFGIIFPLFFIRETYCKSSADFTYLRWKNQ
ncbi:MFS transporter [Alphaproteobacteria bacterium]|nr:MFS transporter [Alphaproteobacteria bacterium]